MSNDNPDDDGPTDADIRALAELIADTAIAAERQQSVSSLLTVIVFSLLRRGPIVVSYSDALAHEQAQSRVAIAIDKDADTITARLVPDEVTVVAEPKGVQ